MHASSGMCVCCVCVCDVAHVYTSTHACVNTNRDHKRMLGVLRCHFLPYAFETRSITEPGHC